MNQKVVTQNFIIEPTGDKYFSNVWSCYCPTYVKEVCNMTVSCHVGRDPQCLPRNLEKTFRAFLFHSALHHFFVEIRYVYVVPVLNDRLCHYFYKKLEKILW